MKKTASLFTVLTLCMFATAATAQLGTCLNATPWCHDSQTISTSGHFVIVQNNGALTGIFEEIVNDSAAPSALSIVITGCGDAGTCTTLDTYTTVANAIRSPAIGMPYAYFKITATWTGGTAVSITINTRLSTALLTGGFPTYTDSFIRADGSLGSNWAEPDGGGCPLTITSDVLLATCINTTHPSAIYTAGTFANNQYSSFIVAATASTIGGQAAFVRGSASVQQFYNDAVHIGATGYALGDAQGTDFCFSSVTNAYQAGDVHELDVVGTLPIFFWSKRNGIVDATCVYTGATGQQYAGGKPGLGMSEDDITSVPTLEDGAWSGGSLPNVSTTPSDNFQRADSGWLGVNWWFDPLSSTSYFKLSANSAVLSSSGGTTLALWTTPFATNSASIVTVGNIGSAGWIGAVCRYSLPTNATDAGQTFYLALAEQNGTVDLFAYSGGYVSLASVGTYSGTVSTLELDAAGTSPVILTVKINGTQYGSTFSDSTYKLAGTYAGFGIASSTDTVVTGWTGS